MALLGGLTACASAPAPPAGGATLSDPAAGLAARLPAGADRCAVARIARLPARRRPYAMRLSHVDPLAWVPDSALVAAAGARWRTVAGRQEVWWLRTSVPPREVKHLLSTRSPTRVSWSQDEPGTYRARFVEPRLLRLSRGRAADPRARSRGPGRCARLLASFPGALEVAARRGAPVFLGDRVDAPRRVDRVLDTTAKFARVRTWTVMADEAQARALEQRPLGGALPGPFAFLLEEDVTRRRAGRVLLHDAKIRWDDLGMAIEDQRRMMAAAQEDHRRESPMPPAEVDVTQLSLARQQQRRWSERLQASRGADRRAAALSLRELLTRAAAAHPDEAGFARGLVRVLLDELGDASAARAVAEAQLSRSPPDGDAWRLLQREAQAAEGPSSLAPSLVEAGVARRREASDAAAQLIAWRAQGVDYAFAESAWVGAAPLFRRLQGMRTVAPGRRAGVSATAPLPLRALFEGMFVWLESRAQAPAGAVYVLVRGSMRPWAQIAWHAQDAPVVRLAGAEPASRWVGLATTGSMERLRGIGQTLSDVLAPGPVEVGVFVVPFRPGAAVGRGLARGPAWRLRGQFEDDALRVERVNRQAADVRWDRLARYLVRPLAELTTRVFPAPDLRIEAEGQPDRDALLTLAAEHEGVRCEAAELTVRCAAAPGHPTALRTWLGRVAQTLLRR